ncbi:MAG: transcription antitermination factor NusB [Lachnospiraceae bacterium]|nr:transcription antitermination factor NusB [Lachnospiraceae bacterium]
MTRAQIREDIFKLLFRIEFNSVEDMPSQIAHFFDNPQMGEDSEDGDCRIGEQDMQYITQKYEQIVNRIPELDALIDSAAKGWKSSRLGKVDLTILRLAVYEMKYDEDIPVGVAINEAVELAKKFGQDESPSFINGILAKLAKSADDE